MAVEEQLHFISNLFHLNHRPIYSNIFQVGFRECKKKKNAFFKFLFVSKYLGNSFTPDTENVHNLLADKHQTPLVCLLQLREVFLNQCWQQCVQYCASRTAANGFDAK
jgi:hypothetical protein